MVLSTTAWEFVSKGQTSYSGVQGQTKNIFQYYYQLICSRTGSFRQYFNLNNAFQILSLSMKYFTSIKSKNIFPAKWTAFCEIVALMVEIGEGIRSFNSFNGDFLKEWFMTNNGNKLARRQVYRWRRVVAVAGVMDCSIELLRTGFTDYQPYYQLKSFTKNKPWDDLVHTCDVLNNSTTPSLDTLLFLLCLISIALVVPVKLFCDDDSYVYKPENRDYYTYYEIETGRRTPQEYDGNSFEANLATSWSASITKQMWIIHHLIKLARPQWREISLLIFELYWRRFRYYQRLPGDWWIQKSHDTMGTTIRRKFIHIPISAKWCKRKNPRFHGKPKIISSLIQK